jgi:flagellar motor switch protein FliN/FliY
MADDTNLAETLEAELSQMAEESAGGGGGDSGSGGGGDAGAGGGAAAANDESGDRNLDLIMDIPLRVTVELGRAKMVVSDLLNLGQGSVIELSKLAGEPMEVLVNDKLVARGEAVVVNEKFGVRLTDIISPTERVEQLK